MKIAQITECLTDNGVSTVVRNLSTGFKEAGHQVDIIVWRQSSTEDTDLKLVRLQGLSDDKPSLASRLLSRLLGQRLWLYLRSAIFSRELMEQVDLNGYDAVLLHGLACIPLWRLPSRCIIVAHSTKSKMLLRPRQLLLRPLLCYLYGRMYRTHPVVCVSNGAREDMIENFNVAPTGVTAIHNPFPLADIRQKALEAIDDVPQNYVLAVGRPVKSKRYDRLMRIYKMSGIQAQLVVLVGSGNSAKIEKLAKRYDLADRVRVIGYRQNPYPYMAGAQLLILTSDYEGLPTVLIESLACGTPVISTDCPSGPREILQGESRNGLVTSKCEVDFAARLRELYRNPYHVDANSLDAFSLQLATDEYLKLLGGQN